MRTLKFIIDGQLIRKDPECDFSNLIPGSEGYLQAEFSFSSDWDGATKVALFYSSNHRDEYPPQVLTNGKTCVIPAEALSKYAFRVGVIGKKRGLKMITNTVAVKQDGGRI